MDYITDLTGCSEEEVAQFFKEIEEKSTIRWMEGEKPTEWHDPIKLRPFIMCADDELSQEFEIWDGTVLSKEEFIQKMAELYPRKEQIMKNNKTWIVGHTYTSSDWHFPHTVEEIDARGQAYMKEYPKKGGFVPYEYERQANLIDVTYDRYTVVKAKLRDALDSASDYDSLAYAVYQIMMKA